ncbi:DUF300-domain-containing protein [Rozella allomycis CSF55]|uniref:DUF300-domain-containing protein n=1 Tax=Rozella allomycis (strain CSF55) TaxID=988480 RepID=A0A4P9YKH1_ROZAC|nr:DUF300-domain-containing protein [Rozella allomycis CSF55]
MYFLILFYLATHKILKAHYVAAKFIYVKAVVFFSFSQGIVISLAVYLEIIRGYNQYTVAAVIQDFSMCIETFIASIAHFYAFSHHDFSELPSGRLPLFTATRDFLGVQDIYQDLHKMPLKGSGFLT